MFGHFVGLDISRNTAKAVLVKKGYKENKLLKTLFTEFNMDDATSIDEFKQLLKEKFIPQNAQIITAINENPLSTRVLSFPFSDPKKVDQVYKFEIDNISSFQSDEKHMDYQLVQTDKGSEALVTIFDEEKFKDYLKHLQDVDINPRYITFLPYAFSEIEKNVEGERPVLLINMDAGQLNFILFDEHGIRRVRNSNDTTTRIRESLNLDKLNFKQLNSSDELRHQFLDQIGSIVDEIKRTAHYFEMEVNKNVSSFVITGELCNITNIEKELGERLGSNVSKLFIPELGTEDSATFSGAYSLALYGCNFNRKKYNLRKGEFKYSGKNFDVRKTFALPLALLAVLLLFIIFKNTSGQYSTRGQIKAINNQMQQEIKSSFPNVSNIPDPLLFLQNELEKVQEQLDILGEIKGGYTPLDILKDISNAIPFQQKIIVDEIRFESNKRIKIWGKCDSYKEIASIEQSLIDSGKYEKVDREQVSRSVNNTIKFVILLALK